MLDLNLQCALEDLMEQISFLLQLVDNRKKKMAVPATIKKDLQDCLHSVFRTVTALMAPSTCFKGIITLLQHADSDVGRKVIT